MLTTVAFLVALSPQLSQPTFEAKLQMIFSTSGTPGAAVGVIKDGKVTYSKAFGVADVEKKTPFSADMRFEIGSLSKQFAAMCVLILVNEGKLKLEDKLGDLVPDLPEKWRGATLDRTLHHMSGVPDYEEIAGYDFYNQARKPSEIIASAASKEPDFKPGEKFYYSNTGYVLISLAVERKAGMSIGQFLQRRIFQPLGMNSTYAEPPEKVDNLPTGYHSRTGSRVAQPPIAWTSTLGAGGIVSTLADFAKWDAALYTDKLVPEKLRAKLWETTTTTTGSPVNYGYGWFMGQFRGAVRQNHSGQTNGFTCLYNRFPQQRTSVMVFTNTYSGGGVFGMANVVAAHFVKDFNFLQMPVPTDPDATRTARHLKDLRAAVFAEGDMATLSPGIKDFATQERFASVRDPIKKQLDTTKSFRFLTKRNSKTAQGEIDEYVYRHTFEGGEVFWAIRYSSGLMIGLNWEDE